MKDGLPSETEVCGNGWELCSTGFLGDCHYSLCHVLCSIFLDLFQAGLWWSQPSSLVFSWTVWWTFGRIFGDVRKSLTSERNLVLRVAITCCWQYANHIFPLHDFVRMLLAGAARSFLLTTAIDAMLLIWPTSKNRRFVCHDWIVVVNVSLC